MHGLAHIRITDRPNSGARGQHQATSRCPTRANLATKDKKSQKVWDSAEMQNVASYNYLAATGANTPECMTSKKG